MNDQLEKEIINTDEILKKLDDIQKMLDSLKALAESKRNIEA